MSAQLQVSGEAKIRDLQGPVVANSGVISALDGAANQYVRGDGSLASFPTTTGGGSSVSYYLNGSVNQGTFGGSTYYQLSNIAITGTGTNFSTSANGLIAQFITDVNNPDATSVPSGNWNIEFYLSVSASSGSLASFYVEIYKYNGTTFTLLATNVATPELLTGTTTIDAYFTSVAFPETVLATTDRLAVKVYANVASKTVTLYTENNRLAQIVTTFSKGILSLNNLTDQQQFFATGTSGSDFNIASSVDIHTFNLPTASATNTGKLSSTDWSTFNGKVPYTGATANVNLGIYQIISNGGDFRAIGANNPIGLVLSSDYTVVSNPKTIYTSFGQSLILGGHEFRSVDGSGTGSITSFYLAPSGAATFYYSVTANSFIKSGGTSSQFLKADGSIDSLSYITLSSLSAGSGISYNNTTGVITSTITQYTDALARTSISLTTTGTSGASTYNNTTGVLNVPSYTLAGLGGQPLATNLTSLSSLTYASTSFLKMTASGTFSLDTNSYLPTIGGTLTGDLFGVGGSFTGGITTYGGLNATGFTNSTGANYVEIGTTSTTYKIVAINRTTGNYNYPLFIDAQKVVLNSTSGGTVGIGVNPSAWGTSWRPLQMGSYGGFISGRTDDNSLFIGKNVFFDGTNWIGTTTGWSQQMFFDSSGNTIFRSVNATANTSTGFNESLRITSEGYLQITPTSTIPSTNNTILSYSSNGYLYIQGGSTGLALAGSGNRNNAIYVNSGSNQIQFHTNDGSNKATLNSGGTLVINNLGTGLVYSSSGGLTSTNPSDKRLKENIVDINWGLNHIMKLRPVSYNWKNDKINQGIQFGFIAQEVKNIMPEAIKEFGNDIKYLGLEKDAIYVTLVIAIQEQQKQIEELKALINK